MYCFPEVHLLSLTGVDLFVESSTWGGNHQELILKYTSLSRSYTNIHCDHSPKNSPPAIKVHDVTSGQDFIIYALLPTCIINH